MRTCWRYLLIAFMLSNLGVWNFAIAKGGQVYQIQNRSIIDWHTIDENKWLDLEEWKKSLAWKEQFGEWKHYIQELNLIEPIGHILECVGKCVIYRGGKNSAFSPVVKSKILERDEFMTKDHSYAYLYLQNGTLLRLSPKTSISLNEINITPQGSFLYIRINYGEVLAIPRVENKFVVRDRPETDVIFYPLTFYEAHIDIQDRTKFKDEELFNYVLLRKHYNKKYEYLNSLIEENSKVKHQTRILFASANGNLLLHNAIADIIVLKNSSMYFQVRSGVEYYYKDEPEGVDGYFISREEESAEGENIELGKWYQVSLQDSDLQEYPEGKKRFYMPSLLSKRIPSILIAREMFVKMFSSFLLKKSDDAQFYAKHYGIRLWQPFGGGSESDQRITFLNNFSRQIERKNIREKEVLKARFGDHFDIAFSEKYDESYYSDAVRAYLFSHKLRNNSYDLKTGALNSTKKKFWKIVTKQYD